MNKVILTGRLTRDPEVRYTQQTGKAVANFSVAVESGFGDNKRTNFIPVTVWDKLAEICGNNLAKGRKVLVEGCMQISEYEKDGQKQRKTEVVAQNVEFLDSKASGDSQTPKSNQPASGGYDVSSFGTEVFPEEEIQF